MRVLFTTPILEHPPAGGPYLRIENSIKALNKISELHILSRLPKKLIGGKPADKFFSAHSFKFGYAPSAHQENFFSKLTRKINQSIKKNENNEKQDLFLDAQFIINYVYSNTIDVVWFGFGNISHDLMVLVKKLDPKIKIVCDTDSVWSKYISRKLPHEQDYEKRKKIIDECNNKKAEEKEWLQFCDAVLAVSEVDAEYYRTLGSDPCNIKIFSNVIDAANYPSIVNNVSTKASQNVFLGGFFENNSPMDFAARWFIKNVWPSVHDAIPNSNLFVIGRNSDRVLNDIHIDGVIIKGKVNSVLPYLLDSGVAVVPLFFESGTRFKILEAGICHIPIVSTTLGAEGLHVENGKHLLIADDAKIFVSSVIKLLSDYSCAEIIKKNCFNLVKNEYTLPKLEREGIQILQYLKSK